MDEFASDQMGVLLGSRVFTRLNIKMGERIRLVGGTGTLHLRVCGVFETGVSQIDKNRIYLHMGTARSFFGTIFRWVRFQLYEKPETGTGSCCSIANGTSSSSSKLAGKGKGLAGCI